MRSRRGRVCVVGTIVIDLVAYTERRPRLGETVLGSSYEVTPGGKGFNQAVAARRAGADVALVGAVGDDAFGAMLVHALHDEGIAGDHVLIAAGKPTGAGFPVVTPDGANSIVIVPGAGEEIDEGFLASQGPDFSSFDIVVIQLELAPAVGRAVAAACHEVGTPVLLNPAPAPAVPVDFLEAVDVITPNELEAAALTGLAEPEEAGRFLADSLPGRRVVVTCGAQGAFAFDAGAFIHVPAPNVDSVVDTVGAGDVFCGYLAAGLARGDSFTDAVTDGVAAASHSVQHKGAAFSAPYREALDSTLSAPTQLPAR